MKNGIMPIINDKLKNPLLIFGIAFVVFSGFFTLRDDRLKEIVRSDGRGYYAYLPALLIYQDGSFQKSAEVEKSYFEHGIDQLYLFTDQKGNQYNKYFPGIALLQLPFFGIACLISWIFNQPIDGYSSVFLFCFYIGSLVYGLLGIRLFSLIIQQLFPQRINQKRWVIPLFYIATPLLYYQLITPSFSHLYSFVFFGLFAWQFFKFIASPTLKNAFVLGLILGMITILRPTNLIILLIIPFLAGSWGNTVSFLKILSSEKGKRFFVGTIGFLIVISLVFLSWKWQTGDWIVWSYSGEGFNFLHPQLWANWFSFRVGLFVHSPLLLISIVGLVLLFKTNRFQAISWILYFAINSWVISSWWCWDYESPFGNRPMTEHLFFMLLPIFSALAKFPKFTYSFLLICSVLGIIRFFEIKTEFMVDQRFTKQNYIASLAFWNPDNHNRWNFTRSCIPFGERIENKVLLNLPETQNILPTEEFAFTVQENLPKPRTNEKYAFTVELQKRIFSKKFQDVYLVIDAFKSDESKRYYKAIELFNDRQEGKSDWSENLVFEGHIHDYLQEYDAVKIYIWNPGKQHFQIRNLQIRLEKYQAN